MKKINKNNLIRNLGILLLLTLVLSIISFGYYTNTNKFFQDSRKDDNNAGFALQREANEFIEDGCGSNTILDTVTGLCWQKDMTNSGTKLWSLVNTYDEPIWNTSTNNYNYPVGRVKSDYPAFEYCDDLNLGTNLNWRLPNRNELMTLINETGGSGSTCMTLTNFNFTNCQNNVYWTEDEYKSGPTLAWMVALADGGDSPVGKTASNYVVCVR